MYGEQPAFFRDGNTRNYDPTKDTIIPQSDNAEQSGIDRLVISALVAIKVAEFSAVYILTSSFLAVFLIVYIIYIPLDSCHVLPSQFVCDSIAGLHGFHFKI